jgi:Proline-rich nuclear receptor coactivator motif
MYVENDKKDSTMTTEEQVNEATAALKGLLGLGVPSTPPQQMSPDAVTENEHVVSLIAPEQGAAKTKKKKNNRKKKPNEIVSTDAPAVDNSTTGTTTNTNTPTPKTAPKSNPKPNKPNGDNPNAKKKKPPKKSNSNSSTHSKTKESENFAWSAFQSSPDASKLPIPAFLSASSTINNSSTETAEDLGIVGNEEGTDKVAATPKATKSENTVGESGAVVPEVGETAALSETPNQEEAVSDQEVAETIVQPSLEEAVSATGVNLAEALAAATSPPVLPPPPPPQLHQSYLLQQQQQQVPYIQSFNRYYPGPPAPLPQFSPMPHHHPHMSQQQHQHQHHQLPQHQYQQQQQQHAPYAPPPGYVTIHVQVPPVLMMPGRQMVVTSPAGYPVHVVVPDGIPPGMIIPVHVPAGPPLHMMPPPPPPPPQRQPYPTRSSTNGSVVHPHHNNNPYTTSSQQQQQQQQERRHGP